MIYCEMPLSPAAARVTACTQQSPSAERQRENENKYCLNVVLIILHSQVCDVTNILETAAT